MLNSKANYLEHICEKKKHESQDRQIFLLDELGALKEGAMYSIPIHKF